MALEAATDWSDCVACGRICRRFTAILGNLVWRLRISLRAICLDGPDPVSLADLLRHFRANNFALVANIVASSNLWIGHAAQSHRILPLSLARSAVLSRASRCGMQVAVALGIVAMGFIYRTAICVTNARIQTRARCCGRVVSRLVTRGTERNRRQCRRGLCQ